MCLKDPFSSDKSLMSSFRLAVQTVRWELVKKIDRFTSDLATLTKHRLFCQLGSLHGFQKNLFGIQINRSGNATLCNRIILPSNISCSLQEIWFEILLPYYISIFFCNHDFDLSRLKAVLILSSIWPHEGLITSFTSPSSG